MHVQLTAHELSLCAPADHMYGATVMTLKVKGIEQSCTSQGCSAGQVWEARLAEASRRRGVRCGRPFWTARTRHPAAC